MCCLFANKYIHPTLYSLHNYVCMHIYLYDYIYIYRYPNVQCFKVRLIQPKQNKNTYIFPDFHRLWGRGSKTPHPKCVSPDFFMDQGSYNQGSPDSGAFACSKLGSPIVMSDYQRALFNIFCKHIYDMDPFFSRKIISLIPHPKIKWNTHPPSYSNHISSIPMGPPRIPQGPQTFGCRSHTLSRRARACSWSRATSGSFPTMPPAWDQGRQRYRKIYDSTVDGNRWMNRSRKIDE